MKRQGVGVNAIARQLNTRKATVSRWLKVSVYEDARGWQKGTYRSHTGVEAKRIIELKKERIEGKKYFLGSPHIRMDYAKKFTGEKLPSLWFFDQVVRDAGLQTHEPKKKKRGQDIVKRLRFPMQSIVKLGRIQQSSDFIGKKWITGRSEPISIFSTSYYQWLQLYQIWRTEAESATCAIVKLSAFWQKNPLPDVMRMDNGMTFRGTGADVARVGTFLKFLLNLLNLGVTPLFSSPYQSYTNPHIEGYNRTFTEKLWERNTFVTTDEIDVECSRFNTESREYYEYAFSERLEQKSLRFLLPDRAIVTNVLTNTRGKKVCFIRFVECWKERDQKAGIILLNRFVFLPKVYLNQYVFVTVNLETSTLSVVSEHDGVVDEILQQPFPYSL
ncbi:hypothetical protein HY772_08635 [Candidatus Woesearchaeota archaeon]|nr:hypothetical protein [Candidatus Woesearchaeota archaeon]